MEEDSISSRYPKTTSDDAVNQSIDSTNYAVVQHHHDVPRHSCFTPYLDLSRLMHEEPTILHRILAFVDFEDFTKWSSAMIGKAATRESSEEPPLFSRDFSKALFSPSTMRMHSLAMQTHNPEDSIRQPHENNANEGRQRFNTRHRQRRPCELKLVYQNEEKGAQLVSLAMKGRLVAWLLLAGDYCNCLMVLNLATGQEFYIIIRSTGNDVFLSSTYLFLVDVSKTHVWTIPVAAFEDVAKGQAWPEIPFELHRPPWPDDPQQVKGAISACGDYIGRLDYVQYQENNVIVRTAYVTQVYNVSSGGLWIVDCSTLLDRYREEQKLGDQSINYMPGRQGLLLHEKNNQLELLLVVAVRDYREQQNERGRYYKRETFCLIAHGMSLDGNCLYHWNRALELSTEQERYESPFLLQDQLFIEPTGRPDEYLIRSLEMELFHEQCNYVIRVDHEQCEALMELAGSHTFWKGRVYGKGGIDITTGKLMTTVLRLDDAAAIKQEIDKPVARRGTLLIASDSLIFMVEARGEQDSVKSFYVAAFDEAKVGC